MKQLLLFIFLISLNFSIAQDFWTEVAPFPNTNYIAKQISIVDDATVWLLGDNINSHIWSKSSDGGITWENGEINLSNPNLLTTSISAVSPNKAYITTAPTVTDNYGGVWVTENGGLSWSQQTTASFNHETSFANFIHFFDENNGVVVGDPFTIEVSENVFENVFEIYTTNNGGLSWVQVPQGNIPNAILNEYGITLKFDAKNNFLFFGTSYGRIYKTNDMGLNWSVSQSPIISFDTLSSFSFKNQNEGLMVSDDFKLYSTQNSGLSWIEQSPSGEFRNYSIEYVPETNNVYFNSGSDINNQLGGASYTTDGGQNWIDLNNVDADPVLPSIAKFKNGTTGYCVGSYLSDFLTVRFFKLTDPLARLTGALSIEKFNINKTSASPNPVKNSTKIIGYQIRTIEVFDITGKVVILENFIPSNEVSLNLKNLKNGIYIAKVKSETDNVSTIKIIKE